MDTPDELAAAEIFEGDSLLAARSLLAPCQSLFQAFRDHGGRALLIGGCVRDMVLARPVKDLDIEVFGLSDAAVRAILAELGSVNLVGQSFAVYKFRPRVRTVFAEIDISLPRRDRKSGPGHRGFEIEANPQLSFAEASQRRDLTVNAIFYDPLEERFIDPQKGLADIRQQILRAVDATTFVEDSLRVLRIAQLAARLRFQVDADTIALCRKIDLDDLPSERVREEIFKLILADRPSIGLRLLDQTGALEQLFPDLWALKTKPSPVNQFEDTCRALDYVAALGDGLTETEPRIALLLTVLIHECRQLDETAVLAILNKLDVHTLNGYHLREQVMALTENYDTPIRFFELAGAGKEPGRLAFAEVVRHSDVALLASATAAHLSERDESLEPIDYFSSRLVDFGFDHGLPAPLLTGRAILDAGIAEAGPRLGRLLADIYDRQLEGEITTLADALEAARQMSGTEPA